MLIPKSTAVFEMTVRNSKFIAIAQTISSREEVKELVAEQWNIHPGARHVVYAFTLGKNAEILGASDDGEPSGTAGMPALEVLKGSEITNCLVMIVRYFGGTKLGTGGLVKAYSDSTKGVLELLETEELIDKKALTICTDYSSLKQIQLYLNNIPNLSIEDEIFTENVEIKCLAPLTEIDAIKEEVNNITNGKAIFT